MTLSGMTNAGLELLIKSQTGTIPEFTKIKIGDGAITDQNIAELDDLINVVDELNIKSYKTSKDTENNTATLQVFTVIAQGDFGFYFREMGLFAIDPDTNEEILYSYVNNGDEAKYIPQCGGNKVVEELASMVVAVSDTDNIIVHCDSELKIEEQIEGNGGYSLFDTVIKDHLLTYEESEGFALQGTYVYKDGIAGERWGYPDFIEQCISEKEEATATRMTLGSSTIIAHVHSNGHIYYDISDKSVVDTFYNTFGAAWFYGVDEENDRVFLPRNDYFFKSATSNPGNYNAPQLPSLAHSHILTISGGSHSHSATLGSSGSHTHTRGTMNIAGTFSGVGQYYNNSSHTLGATLTGAFYRVNTANKPSEGVKILNGRDAAKDDYFGFDASRNWTGSTSSSGSHSHSVTVGSDSHTHSGSAASANPAGSLSGSTVLPPSVNGLLYIVVGNVRQKSAVVINAELTSAIAAMDNKKSLVLDDINDAKDTAIGAITTAKTGAISDIEDAGAAQLELINSDLNTASEYADEAQRQAEIAEEYANVVVAGQQQTDFTQNDPNAIDFIKNKPDCDWLNIVYKEVLQTLKNKSIDGSENTITNLPFSSLLSSMVLTEINRQNATNNTLATTAAILDAIFNFAILKNSLITDLSNHDNISDETIPSSLAVYNSIQYLANTGGLNLSEGDGIEINTVLNTNASVISSNDNLTVTSSYTGTMGAVGTITYNFTYGEYDDNGSAAYGWLDDNGDIVDLTNYDLTVVGTPEEDDVITLKYITTSTTTISADVENFAGSVEYADLPDNPHYSFINGLSSTQTRQTSVNIVSSNEDLTITSSYTGTQSSVGIIEYLFIYNDNAWTDADGNAVNLANYDLTVVGTPEEDDSITLTYTTIYNTVVSGQTLPTRLSDLTDDLGTNPTHSHSQYLTNHQDISGKEDIAKAMTTLAASGTVALADNSVNKITPSGTITFNLPNVTDTTKFHQILVQLNLSAVVTINTGTTYYFNKTAPDLSNAGVYNLIYEYDNANGYWVCGAITKGAAS